MRLAHAYVVRKRDEASLPSRDASILPNASAGASMDSLQQDQESQELESLQPASADPYVSAVDFTDISMPEQRFRSA